MIVFVDQIAILRAPVGKECRWVDQHVADCVVPNRAVDNKEAGLCCMMIAEELAMRKRLVAMRSDVSIGQQVVPPDQAKTRAAPRAPLS